MAADDLLARTRARPTAEVLDGLGGVLCRCTGYTSIVEAVRVGRVGRAPPRRPIPAVGAAVGARIARTDGLAKVTGAELFGDDLPADGAWHLRAVRSPHAHARFRVGDLAPVLRPPPGPRPDPDRRRRPGRQPVRDLRDGQGPAGARRGLRPVPRRGRAGARRRRRDRRLDRRRRAADRVGAAAAAARDRRRAGPGGAAAPRGVARERARRGPRPAGRRGRRPRRGRGRRRPGRSRRRTSSTPTSSPRPGPRASSTAASRSSPRPRRRTWTATSWRWSSGCREDRVRVIPSACGGGFGGKLDLSLQPLIAIAALPARSPGPRGLSAARVDGRDDQAPPGPDRGHVRRRRRGAADRRPRPRRLRHRRLRVVGSDGRQPRARSTRWARTRSGRCSARAAPCTPTARRPGAFRGFGVPQAAIAHEALMDDLAEQLGHRPARAPRRATRSTRGRGPRRPRSSSRARACPPASTRCGRAGRPAGGGGGGQRGRRRRRVRAAGVGRGVPMWYGIGNTSLPNPSEIEVGIRADGTVVLFSGATDIGQGSNTILAQIAADALGVLGRLDRARRPRHATSRSTPARPRPRARPSCRGTRPGSPPRTCAASC